MIKDFINSPSLSVDSPWYSKYLKGLADLWFLNDLNGKGDLTTDFAKAKSKGVAKARIIAKENGLLAGTDEVKWLFDNHPRFKGAQVKFLVKDRVKKGQIVADVSGRYEVLMVVERLILNILQRMSGVATLTAELSSKVNRYGVKLACTRKTYWGPLDKWACVAGGGASHRLGLWDAVLIKDNHLKAGVNLDFTRMRNAKFIDIEIEDLGQLGKVLGELKAGKTPVIFMLDNFNIAKIPDAIKIVRGAGHHVELSGGINPGNLMKYAKLRPDFISMGCLTQDARALDLGMDLLPSH